MQIHCPVNLIRASSSILRSSLRNRYSYIRSLEPVFSEGDGGNVVAIVGPVVEEQLQLPAMPDVGLLHTSS